jgi:hypothetical protein
MSARSASAAAALEAPKFGTGLLRAVASALVCPFDCVLAGMIGAGLGVEAICAYLGLSRATFDYNLVRLDLPSPHERPRRRGGRRAWTDDELRCAIYWRCLGIHPESIGLVFGRSTSAVRSKMHRLGVPAPGRKKLHKVDVATLDRTPPNFGFPVPSDEQDQAPTNRLVYNRHDSSATVPPASDVASPASAATPTPKNARQEQITRVAGQRDLTKLRVAPASKPAAPETAPDVNTGNAGEEKTAETLAPVRETLDDGGHNQARVSGPADLIAKFQVIGKVRHAEANEPYLTWLTLLYLGGMHYRAISTYLGQSPSAVQSVLNRMQIPRDAKRSKFGWTCDLECAVATLEQWDFVLQRCGSNPQLADYEKPLFWRHKDDRYNRKRRCSRLKNREIGEHFKYKGGLSVEIITREQLEAQRRRAIRDAGVRHPSRSHACMQGLRPIQQGAAHEQFAPRGHAPAVRPGLSRDARDPMPWAYARNGSAARPVAHP